MSIDAWAQMVIFTRTWTRCGRCTIVGTGCILGRAPYTKETLPIFMSGVRLPDIHKYSAGSRVVNGPPGNGASQLGIRAKVNDYLGSSVGVKLCIRYT